MSPQSTWRIIVAGVIFAGVAVAVIACGDSEPAITDSRAAGDAPMRQTTERPLPTDRMRSENSSGPARTTDESPAVTKDSGAVYVPPEKPTKLATAPVQGCRDREESSGGRTLRVSFPPAPGVQATRVGDQIKVDYRFGPVPSRCKPVALEVTLDVNDDPLPGRSSSVEISALRGSARVKVPSDLHDVDVVRVVARTERGAPSESAAVPIQ